MKKILPIVAGQRSSPLLRALGRRYFAGSTNDYEKRNCANNVSEYNTVIDSLISQRRHYLLRDVYDDTMLDGVRPSRNLFHSLIVGTWDHERSSVAGCYLLQRPNENFG